ncbi:bolA-like protein 3 [Cimex lectularius]|uniref:Bola-like protein n=1 Tax=Cimex lectularius TaxID=79782 RepID=A0A8I6RZU4_CIMLE|nr:bolA-like protein 3 [Cimex lectularius]
MFNMFNPSRYVVSLSLNRSKVNVIPSKSLSLVKFWSSKKEPKAEDRIKAILTETFPKANSIDVVDVSGGCGAMFEIAIQAPQFKGLPIVKQHRLVTEALKEEIKDMHGFRIHTSS